MRIGVDARYLAGNLTGTGRYVREILLCLDDLLPDVEWLLYTRRPIALDWPSARWRVVVDPHPLWRLLPGLVWVKLRLGSLAQRDSLDAFWAAGTLSPSLKTMIVATVYDLNHVLVPETMRLVNRFAFRRWFTPDVRAASQVITISQGTATRLRELVGRSADGVAVPGSRWSGMGVMVFEGRPFDDPYVLSVATREPRKNLSSLITAFAALKARGLIPRHLLVLVGNSGWGKKLEALHGDRPVWLRELGYVPDHKMAALFAHAHILVQPSHYEGFGMPAAEAASFGTRVVATDIPELREAAGPFGVFTRPDPESVAQGILDALAMPDPSPYPGSSWKDAAEVMAKAFKQVSRVSTPP
ncbi:glycosyltransferase family 4 protein [Variovorax paradoxus]|uniref:glycosyltransferase family 4 protein n=1 Tax=Variovorax paradoxus TaxID=34073 RepID=UPI0028651A7F|nr:glycosyltransferase family 1 protein [Variovorax paradoxus]MDR6453089.1 glycosyltransferase involved in cell wall biosynthesis [Variovorax paradoxus]